MSPETYEAVAKKVIADLVAVLPNGEDREDETWLWCWNELSDEAQEKVQTARRAARDFESEAID